MNQDGTRTRLLRPLGAGAVLARQIAASGNPRSEGITLVLCAGINSIPDEAVSSTGSILLRLDRIFEKARTSVKFALAPYQSVAVDLSRADAVELSILHSTAVDCPLSVSWSPRPLPSTRAVGWWPESVDAAGTYAVPPGAVSVSAAVADPGFGWRQDGLDGAALTVPAPIAVGETAIVAGAAYQTSGAFSGIWRIEL